MATVSTPISYRVGDVSIDLTRRVVRRFGGEEIHLKPKAFAILLYLLEHRDRLVTKQELMDVFWKDTAVTDDALTQCIADLRRALADTPRDPRYVKTIPRVGFRFIGEVEEVRPDGMLLATEEVTTVEIREEFSDEAPIVVLPPPSTRRRYLFAGIAMALLTIGAATVSMLRTHSLPDPPAAPAGKRQIAVLRFENRTGQSDLDWLRDGVPDMLTSTLSRSRTLDVLSREQVLLWMNRTGSNGLPDVLEVARRSHAEAAVIGSFGRLGNTIRVDARAYDGRTGSLLAAESINVEKADLILREVDFLGARLASRLALKPSHDDRSDSPQLTNNLEAYRSYVLGRGKAEAFQPAAAVELFKKAVALDPGFAMAYARIGYTYAVISGDSAQGRPYLEKAYQMTDKLGEKDRRHIVAWYAVANQDHPEAIRRYRELIAAYPNEVEAYYRLGVLLRSESQLEEAVDLFRRALSIDPDDPALYNSLSAALTEMGRHPEAIELAQHYLTLTPGDENALDTLGLAYQMAGRYAEGEAAFQKALEINPGFEVAHIHRAILYMQTGREQEGMAELRHRAEAAPSLNYRWRYWSLMSWYSWRRGQLEQARSAVLSGRRLSKDNVNWSPAVLLLPPDGVVRKPDPSRWAVRTQYFFLAQEARLKGRQDEMLESLRQALHYRTALGTPEPLEDALADGYLEVGKVDEAIAEYQRALQLYPGMAMAHYHLGQAYLRKARTVEAKAEFRNFLAIWAHADPNLPEIAQARKQAE